MTVCLHKNNCPVKESQLKSTTYKKRKMTQSQPTKSKILAPANEKQIIFYRQDT